MYRKATSRFTIGSACTPETAEKYLKAQTEIKKLKAQIESEFWASPVGAVVRASNSGMTPKVTFDEQNGYLNVDHYVNFVEGPLPATQIEPTILNTLLHTKLLTDAEKRDLLREQGILKPKEVVPTPEA